MHTLVASPTKCQQSSNHFLFLEPLQSGNAIIACILYNYFSWFWVKLKVTCAQGNCSELCNVISFIIIRKTALHNYIFVSKLKWELSLNELNYCETKENKRNLCGKSFEQKKQKFTPCLWQKVAIRDWIDLYNKLHGCSWDKGWVMIQKRVVVVYLGRWVILLGEKRLFFLLKMYA